MENLPGSDLGNPDMGMDTMKASVPVSKNPIHQAPTHCGLSGVISNL